jgi:hypothetical protein
MAPQVRKAKTAFLFFQADKLALIKKELNLSMGDAMTEVRIIQTCVGSVVVVDDDHHHSKDH